MGKGEQEGNAEENEGGDEGALTCRPLKSFFANRSRSLGPYLVAPLAVTAFFKKNAHICFLVPRLNGSYLTARVI